MPSSIHTHTNATCVLCRACRSMVRSRAGSTCLGKPERLAYHIRPGSYFVGATSVLPRRTRIALAFTMLVMDGRRADLPFTLTQAPSSSIHLSGQRGWMPNRSLEATSENSVSKAWGCDVHNRTAFLNCSQTAYIEQFRTWRTRRFNRPCDCSTGQGHGQCPFSVLLPNP
jgi:hypothetical protein